MRDQENTLRTTDPQILNLKAALETAAAGLSVFPVKVTRGPDGRKRAKPYVKWKAAATTERPKIKSWWHQWPDAVPGAATGGVFVVDLDTGNGRDGEAAYRAFGLNPDAAALSVRTPSGGRHLYFSGEGAEGLTISASGIGPGVDGHRQPAPSNRCHDSVLGMLM